MNPNVTGPRRIAVLMGGPSGEHDVSLKSGQGIVAALRRRGWSTEPVVLPRELSAEETSAWVRTTLPPLGMDLAFLALHGPFGEDGTIQALCEELGLAYTGSDAAASRLGMEKAGAKVRFAAAGLRVPRGITISAATPGQVPSIGREALAGFSIPLVVKPAEQGSSLGVSIVRQPEELAGALASAARFGGRILVEEFVAGREVTVGVLGEQALPVVEIRPRHAFFDFAAKYTVGMTDYLVPAPLDQGTAQRVQAAGLAAHRALGCRHLSRTDIILQADGEPVILEVNTIPGFTPTSLVPKAAACAGFSYDELCEQLLLMAWHEKAAPVDGGKPDISRQMSEVR